MTLPLRVLDTALRPARWNIAMTAAMVELHQAGRIPDTLRFHRYPRAVLLGRHQAFDAAIDHEACRQRRVEIARRVTGGGAVYMSPDVLAWDLIIERRFFGGSLDKAARVICCAMAAGLAKLGIHAAYRPLNDIAVDGRKIAGASGYFDGASLAYQGSLLVDANVEEMAETLALSPALVRGALTTVKEQAGVMPTNGRLKTALTDAVAEALWRTTRLSIVTQTEIDLAARLLADEIGTEAFIEDKVPVLPEPKASLVPHGSPSR